MLFRWEFQVCPGLWCRPGHTWDDGTAGYDGGQRATMLSGYVRFSIGTGSTGSASPKPKTRE
jgi:hypothetical protein